MTDGCETPDESNVDPFASTCDRDDQAPGSFVPPTSGAVATPMDAVPEESKPVKYKLYVPESSRTLGSRSPPLSKEAGLPRLNKAPPAATETGNFVHVLPSVDVASPSLGRKSLPRVP